MNDTFFFSREKWMKMKLTRSRAVPAWRARRRGISLWRPLRSCRGSDKWPGAAGWIRRCDEAAVAWSVNTFAAAEPSTGKWPAPLRTGPSARPVLRRHKSSINVTDMPTNEIQFQKYFNPALHFWNNFKSIEYFKLSNDSETTLFVIMKKKVNKIKK